MDGRIREGCKNRKVAHFENFAKELGKYYEVVAYRNMENQFATVVTDVTERKKNLKELKVHNARLEALTKILKCDFDTLDELLQFVLEQILILTESSSGCFFYYDENNKKFTLQACSDDLNQNFSTEDRRMVFDLVDIGFWGEAVNQRGPFILNEELEFEKYKEVFYGFNIKMSNILSLPVIVNNEIKAVVSVANKSEDYIGKDIKQVVLLTDTFWKVFERKQYDEKLVLAIEKAEESDRLKSAFLANMSHEIRTPMNGILGFAGMLKEKNISTAERDNYIDVIEKSGQRMLNTINDLMDISRIESNLVEVFYSDINVNEQLDSLFSFFQPEAQSKGIQLTYKKFLADEDAIIKTDKDKLYAVLMNLIKNAMKYTERGSIEFGYKVGNKILQFFVKDTGIGIEGDQLEVIFDRFIQADNSLSRPYEGVGLGLSIAKAYTEMIGGKISVKSEKGVGSEFFLELPYKGDIKEKVPSIISKAENDMKKFSSSNILKDITVLVAEDDEVGRLYLQQLLDGNCKEVLYAKDGKEAVNIYSEHGGVDLVLMDIKMPVMDGYSATIKIRAIDHKAIIIAQTAYALSGDREKAIAAGCDEYLTKPLDKEALFSIIKKLFKK